MAKALHPSHFFTLKFNGRARVLHTPMAIALPAHDGIENPKYQTQCIWDTGCSNTTITQKVVDALGLKPTGVTRVNTASETNKQTSTYLIDLFLSDDLVYRGLTVNLGVICDGIDCLLGMDVITTGDFSVSNLNGNTCMSFRVPSQHEVDFTKDHAFGIVEINKSFSPKPSKENNYAGTPGGAKCPCGSGKQYKRCHGKKK